MRKFAAALVATVLALTGCTKSKEPEAANPGRTLVPEVAKGESALSGTERYTHERRSVASGQMLAEAKKAFPGSSREQQELMELLGQQAASTEDLPLPLKQAYDALGCASGPKMNAEISHSIKLDGKGNTLTNQRHLSCGPDRASPERQGLIDCSTMSLSLTKPHGAKAPDTEASRAAVRELCQPPKPL